MNVNKAAGNVVNHHQMVLVLLRGSLLLFGIPKKNVHFSLANPFSHLCTADVSVPLDTNER